MVARKGGIETLRWYSLCVLLHTMKVAILAKAIFAIWCELFFFKFIVVTYQFVRYTQCIYVAGRIFFLEIAVERNSTRWQSGSAFSGGCIKSINFDWTFVFQVCVLCNAQENLTIQLLLQRSFNSDIKVCVKIALDWIVCIQNERNAR